jgi:hypothetical protein
MLFITSVYQEQFDVWRQCKGKIIILKNKTIIDLIFWFHSVLLFACVIFVLLRNIYSREKKTKINENILGSMFKKKIYTV